LRLLADWWGTLKKNSSENTWSALKMLIFLKKKMQKLFSSLSSVKHILLPVTGILRGSTTLDRKQVWSKTYLR